ncbi:GNAT family N-acetyltransferase [Lactiplantibacillus nangangensis]|uniref:GNAT family N-acetyltransferase n=1 Tax=Lactiplantibacillus nangangensis TaxID=2559917 RepID=A0ABW1SGS2_9LACO
MGHYSRKQDHPIGNIAIWNFIDNQISAELAYGLHPSAQGHGYTPGALSQVKKITFNTFRRNT